MNKRILVFLDLLDLIERMHFDKISFDFLKIIIDEEIKKGNFPRNFKIQHKKTKY
jgi:hypothetical protein